MKTAHPLFALLVFGLISDTKAGTTPSVEAISEAKSIDGGWYFGMEGGYIQHKFNPHYTPTDGSGSFDFTDRSEGTEMGLVAGYGFGLNERFSLLAQLRGSWNNSEWNYNLLSEPARFKYDNPFNFELSAQPTFKLTNKLGIFATLGIVSGLFNEEKTSGSPTEGDYDARDWLFGHTLGGGISYQITNSLECRLSLRKSFYDELTYRDFLPSGGQKNFISDKPETQTLSLAFIYSF